MRLCLRFLKFHDNQITYERWERCLDAWRSLPHSVKITGRRNKHVTPFSELRVCLVGVEIVSGEREFISTILGGKYDWRGGKFVMILHPWKHLSRRKGGSLPEPSWSYNFSSVSFHSPLSLSCIITSLSLSLLFPFFSLSPAFPHSSASSSSLFFPFINLLFSFNQFPSPCQSTVSSPFCLLLPLSLPPFTSWLALSLLFPPCDISFIFFLPSFCPF